MILRHLLHSHFKWGELWFLMLFPSIVLRTKSRSPHVFSPFVFHSFSNNLWIVSPVPGTVVGAGAQTGSEADKNHRCRFCSLTFSVMFPMCLSVLSGFLMFNFKNFFMLKSHWCEKLQTHTMYSEESNENSGSHPQLQHLSGLWPPPWPYAHWSYFREYPMHYVISSINTQYESLVDRLFLRSIAIMSLFT